jgi:hypothetical protein
MNLQELKEMIKEEFDAYTEQAEPTVDVSDADIDADGDEDSEETLRQIYDMLKDYFEGGNDAGDGADADDADDNDEAEEKDAEPAEEKEELQERFKKLANIIKG